MESVSSPFSVQLGSFSDKTLLALTIPPASQAREMILLALPENQDRHFAYMDPKCRKGILLKTGVNEGGFWEPPNLPDRPLLYRLLTFSVKRSVACVAREIQGAALEIWRSHAILQAPRPPLSTGSCTAGTSANFIFLKCGFPLPFVCLVVVVVVFVFYYFL